MNNYQLESTLVQNSITNIIEKNVVKYKSYFTALIVGIVLAILLNIILGIAVAFLLCMAIYCYQFWMSISTMSFTTEGLKFDLNNVIRDLEYM